MKTDFDAHFTDQVSILFLVLNSCIYTNCFPFLSPLGYHRISALSSLTQAGLIPNLAEILLSKIHFGLCSNMVHLYGRIYPQSYFHHTYSAGIFIHSSHHDDENSHLHVKTIFFLTEVLARPILRLQQFQICSERSSSDAYS